MTLEDNLELLLKRLDKLEISEILDVKQAAKYLIKSDSTIRKYIKEGVIPFHKKEGAIYFIRQELLNWVMAG